jgi:hypothetical protein
VVALGPSFDARASAGITSVAELREFVPLFAHIAAENAVDNGALVNVVGVGIDRKSEIGAAVIAVIARI